MSKSLAARLDRLEDKARGGDGKSCVSCCAGVECEARYDVLSVEQRERLAVLDAKCPEIDEQCARCGRVLRVDDLSTLSSAELEEMATLLFTVVGESHMIPTAPHEIPEHLKGNERK